MKHIDIINGLVLSIGKPEYSIPELVHLCKPFGISENSVRTSLSRSVRKGYFEVRRDGRRAFYLPGKKMNRITDEVAKSFNLPDWSGWDNEWWGVTFSVPESDKPKRHRIRKSLKLYRFAPLTNGFWIRPRSSGDQLDIKLQDLRGDTDCRVLRFSCMDPFSVQEAVRIWDLDNIHAFYLEQIRLLSESAMTGKLSPANALRRRIYLGNRIIPVFAADPLLPEALLPPEWPGKEVRDIYFQYDRWLKEQAKPYWD